MARQLAELVAAAPRSSIEGRFERHVSHTVRDFMGTNAGGRWGPAGGYAVLYLGRPRHSIVVEAYRLLVDRVEGMTAEMVAPRRLLVCDVAVTEILDLRTPHAQALVGLSEVDLLSPPGMHDPCITVARVAHQLGLHGIIAPAATGLGETLALFQVHVPPEQWPTIVAEERWDTLPPDPRRLHVVRDDDAGLAD